jgi:acetolactate decarboxylase
MRRGSVELDKITTVEIQLPREAAFDTYALKSASQDEIKEVEQGK